MAIEPVLEIVELRSVEFRDAHARAWFCLSMQRTIAAQPSTRDGLDSFGQPTPS